MRVPRFIALLTSLLALAVRVATAAEARPAGEVFGHEVLPILQSKCLKCHGDGKTKGGLDMTTLANVMKGGSDGPVVVPGKSVESAISKALVENDMPPKGEKHITKDELATIQNWIDASVFPTEEMLRELSASNVHDRAKTLWSFHPPTRPALPDVKNDAEVRTPIDRFIIAKLEASALSLRPEADRRVLIRRVYFDMLGLPPTPQEVEDFVQSSDPHAWEHLVEHLLASPQYGERWGRHWLDVAGWAESSLLIFDAVRPDFWRYRDWVIRAFNDDKPYDQFVREQLAGDEMVDWRNADVFTPDMVDKLTATGFLRCTPDGTDNQPILQTEKRYAAQQTTVEVATKALLGLTANCTRCHDHKFDPLTQEEYYRTVAIFQPAYDPEHWIPGMVDDFSAGPFRAIPLADRAGREVFERHMEELGREDGELSYQKDVGIYNKFRDRYLREHLEELPPSVDREVLELALAPNDDRKRSDAEKLVIANASNHFNINPPMLRKAYPEYEREQNANSKKKKELYKQGNEVGDLIWALWDVSPTPSPTRLLIRGDFNKPGREVTPGVFQALDDPAHPWALPAESPATSTTGRRLAYAQWITRPDHPLTTRVMVNRLWQFHFGEGIVTTPDDFGTRGARPSHPELLDWLAREFVESGWSIKHIHRLILLSSTYRQSALGEVQSDTAPASSAVTTNQNQTPATKLLFAAFPRHRLEAEAIRDAMLSVSGLLDHTMFGKSVPTENKPDGSYEVPNQDPGRYRRSVYLWTRRTWLPTFLTLFDAPPMDTNWSKRSDSAIAPQSLAQMNHPFVLECSAAFADRLCRDCADFDGRLNLAFALAYSRSPQPEEREMFRRYLDERVNATSSGGHDVEREAWRDVAHALLISNEFLYLD